FEFVSSFDIHEACFGFIIIGGPRALANGQEEGKHIGLPLRKPETRPDPPRLIKTAGKFRYFLLFHHLMQMEEQEFFF
ncbi:MAG: hypothetical protein QG578_235, partial [Thermodesulfobacteriota bacterium]|nr:hypothetical protein [Thermodesulfobacteriota bacterium]